MVADESDDVKAWGDEEDAAFAVGTANAAHIIEVRNAIDGWDTRSRDELGSDRYCEGIGMARY